MPSATMDGTSRNGSHTNHDRDPIPNGTNGSSATANPPGDNDKALGETQAPSQQLSNGSNGALSNAITVAKGDEVDSMAVDMAQRVEKLPPEIVHITQGFEPLSKLLTRLSQVSHNRLSAKVMELAAMPTPSSAVNGNMAYISSGVDDNSVDNLRKKVNLLKFAENTHANWTKALVMTQWSRVSEQVSKVIDLKVHIDGQKNLYEAALFDLSEVKRSLIHARVPNPDLKTAVEVLSTGKASWMPDLGYVDPPPLTAKELLKALQDLDTLLYIRLNLHEYHKIPPQMRDYSIKSGRATFRVPGEFEVDLTIADEDPNKQFWFIDFRFLFRPAILELPENLRYIIENRANAALEKEGLIGCYKLLHDLTLTHKISEMRRQAFDLSRAKWIETLQVEPLHRALSIQYWVDRYGKDGPRSWIILGMNSGKGKNGLLDPKRSSYISLRWFRDSKEIKDHDIALESTNISTQSLLHTVISRHISHILSSMYTILSAKPLFATKQLAISFKPIGGEVKEPELHVQLTRHGRIVVTIEPVTGCFAISPASRLATRAEWKLNSQSRDPAANAHEFIENLRCVAVSEEVVNRAISVGWLPVRNISLKNEDLKPIVPRDTLQLSWFRRLGWGHEWFVALSSGMSGERWWLLEITNGPTSPRVSSHFQIPLGTTSPNHTHALLSSLHLYAAALVFYYTNVRALHSKRAPYLLQKRSKKLPPSIMEIPSLFVKMAEILPSHNKSARTGKAWARNILKISFQGLEFWPNTAESDSHSTKILPATEDPTGADNQATSAVSEGTKPRDLQERSIVIAEAKLMHPMPPSLDIVKRRVDKDIAFHPKSGAFAFRLHIKVGQSVVTSLVERLQRVEQLVEFVDVVKKHEKTLQFETVSLGKIVFRYGNGSGAKDLATSKQGKNYRATVDFSGADMPMSLIFESGNPQIRILDHLTKTLNSPLGLNGVALLLPLTLPLMRAFDAVEDAWASLGDRGEVNIFDRAIDWHIIRYSLTSTQPDQKPRAIMIEVRLQSRHGEAWWCIRRDKARSAPGDPTNDIAVVEDEFDKALQTIWEDGQDGTSSRGMLRSAISRVHAVEELVRKVDGVMRVTVLEVVPAGGSSSGAREPQQKAGPAGHLQQQQRESNRQSGQGQQHSGRNGTRHDMIVID